MDFISFMGDDRLINGNPKVVCLQTHFLESQICTKLWLDNSHHGGMDFISFMGGLQNFTTNLMRRKCVTHSNVRKKGGNFIQNALVIDKRILLEL